MILILWLFEMNLKFHVLCFVGKLFLKFNILDLENIFKMDIIAI